METPDPQTSAQEEDVQSGRPWTDEDVEKLLAATAAGRAWSDLAPELHRTASAVARKARKMGLREHRPQPDFSDVVISITAPGVDPERLMLEGVDTSGGPTFSIGEVTKMLGQKTHWLRWREKRLATGEGIQVGTRREIEIEDEGGEPDPHLVGARQYTLSDMEKLAHLLAERGHIDGATAGNLLSIVYFIARNVGYLGDPDPSAQED